MRCYLAQSGVREQTKPGCVFGEPVAVCFQRGSLIRASSCQRFVSALRPSLWSCQMGKMNTFKPICTETIHHVYYQLSFTHTQTPSLFSLAQYLLVPHFQARYNTAIPFLNVTCSGMRMREGPLEHSGLCISVMQGDSGDFDLWMPLTEEENNSCMWPSGTFSLTFLAPASFFFLNKSKQQTAVAGQSHHSFLAITF